MCQSSDPGRAEDRGDVHLNRLVVIITRRQGTTAKAALTNVLRSTQTCVDHSHSGPAPFSVSFSAICESIATNSGMICGICKKLETIDAAYLPYSETIRAKSAD